MLQNSKTQKPAISMLPAVIQHCPQDTTHNILQQLHQSLTVNFTKFIYLFTIEL